MDESIKEPWMNITFDKICHLFKEKVRNFCQFSIFFVCVFKAGVKVNLSEKILRGLKK